MTITGWASFIGGIAFFYLGLRLSRDGIQLVAGERLRLFMGRLPHSRFFAVLADALVAMSLLSSRAAIRIAVNFAENQLMTLSHAFAVVLAADIGTGIVILLLSVREFVAASLYLVGGGIVLEQVARSRRMRNAGSIITGFGLILFGMQLLYGMSTALAGYETVGVAAGFMARHPLAVAILAVIFTFVARSTAATIALAIAMAYAGILTFETAIPLVIGANIGSAIMAARACARQGSEGKRVAIFHVAVKLAGAAIVLPLAGPIAAWAAELEGALAQNGVIAFSAGVEIALGHILYNLLLALLFLPIIGPLAALATRLVRAGDAETARFGPKHLSEEALEEPPLAFAAARREVMRIAKIAADMFANILTVFRMDIDFPACQEMAAAADDKIDMLEKSVRFYLARISQKSLTEAQAADEVALLTIAGDLEDVGDTIQRDLMMIARRKREKQARFSDEGLAELKHLHSLVLENFELMITMLVRPHEEIVLKMMRHEKRLSCLEQELRQSHLQRLHEGRPDSCETSTIHLDILNGFRTINLKLAKIVQTAAELA